MTVIELHIRLSTVEEEISELKINLKRLSKIHSTGKNDKK